MTATFVIYIDESGDEGFSFAPTGSGSKGSSEWFVLSAIITRKARDLETVKLTDRVRERLNKPPKKPLHFRDLHHNQRVPLIAEIAKTDLRSVSVLIHKPSIDEPERFGGNYRLYFYAIRYLFERVSWYCRDHKVADDTGDGTADIIFSNRAGMSYDKLKDYLALLQRNAEAWDVRISWPMLRIDAITAYTPGKRMGLQIADAVAGGFFNAVEMQYGYTEDRYARMLKPIVYQHSGKYLGYGLKFWPAKVDELIDNEDRFEWVRNLYK